MRSIYTIAMVLAVVAIAAVTSSAGEQGYQVIVNSSRRIKQASHAELADYFLKRDLNWSDGVAVTPVDLTMKSEVRRSFTEDVLANSVNALLAYWERQIFSGRKVPPQVKGSDEAVIDFVRRNAGAVGYISSKTQLPPGVTALTVVWKDDRRAGSGVRATLRR